MFRRAIASGAVLAFTCAVSGCAVRYDQAGVSRVGVFLWGFGDPPGVKWNLDAPRREVPDLPAATRRELPARAPDRPASTMNDNRDRVPRSAPDSAAVPVPRRADARDGGAAVG